LHEPRQPGEHPYRAADADGAVSKRQGGIMSNSADRMRLQAKRQAVIVHLEKAFKDLNLLSGMWEEKTLDALILAFGIGHVELYD
jgi:hypothetical protein